MIPYSRQQIDQDDIDAVVQVLKSDFLTQGPAVQQFEHDLAEKVEARYAVAFSSGTAALSSARACAWFSRVDVLTTPLTFVATANAIRVLGGKIWFVDVDPGTFCTHAEAYAEYEEEQVMAVHYAGRPLNLEPIRDKSVIEDAAHALGAVGPHGPVGNCAFSRATCFSFHPVKAITTGEGGAVTTNDLDLAKRLREFRDHGRRHGQVAVCGFNYRLTDIQAALGSSQLRKLDGFMSKRARLATLYRERLGHRAFPMRDVPDFPDNQREFLHGTVVPQDNLTGHANHLFPVLVPAEARAQLVQHLWHKGFQVQTHYRPIYLHPYYQKLGYGDGFEGLCPVAENIGRRVLSLPLWPNMPDHVVDDVLGEMYEFLFNKWFRQAAA